MKNDPDDRFIQEIDQSKITDHASRLRDMLLMRNHNIVPMHDFSNPMVDLNVRFLQYISQFNSYTIEFLILQTVQDFNRFLHVKQSKQLDKSQPVAVLKDGTVIYVNKTLVRSDFVDAAPFMFINEVIED